MKILLKILPVVVMTALALVAFGSQGVVARQKAQPKLQGASAEKLQSGSQERSSENTESKVHPDTQDKSSATAHAQQRSQSKAEVAKALHQVALKALDERRFVIRAEQLYFPDAKANVKTAQNGHLWMQGSATALKLDDTAFYSGSVKGRLPSFQSQKAQITGGKIMRGGDVQYTMTFRSEGHVKELLTITITVFRGSDKCSVKVDSDSYSSWVVTLKGRVELLQDAEVVS